MNHATSPALKPLQSSDGTRNTQSRRSQIQENGRLLPMMMAVAASAATLRSDNHTIQGVILEEIIANVKNLDATLNNKDRKTLYSWPFLEIGRAHV